EGRCSPLNEAYHRFAPCRGCNAKPRPRCEGAEPPPPPRPRCAVATAGITPSAITTMKVVTLLMYCFLTQLAITHDMRSLLSQKPPLTTIVTVDARSAEAIVSV